MSSTTGGDGESPTRSRYPTSDDDDEGWRPSPRKKSSLDLLEGYVPDEDDWFAKTVLNPGDPARASALHEWEWMFPFAAHQQPVRKRFVENWMKAKTSRAVNTEDGLHGQSRMDFKEIFTALFGGGKDKASETLGRFASAFAGDINEDD